MEKPARDQEAARSFWGKLGGRRTAITLALIIILALGMRLIHLGDKIMVLDEPHTIGDVKPGLPGTLLEAADDERGPLYYVILWAASPGGVLGMRLLSVLFGVLSILVIFLLGKEIFGGRVGLAAAFLLALHPFHIAYSQYIRDNMLFFLLLAVSFLFFYRFAKTGKGLFPLLIANGLVAFTHILSTLFFATQLVTLFFLNKEWKPFVKKYVFQLIIIALAVSPWAYLVAERDLYAGEPPINYDVLKVPHALYKISIGVDASSFVEWNPLLFGAAVLLFSFLFVAGSLRILKADPFAGRFLAGSILVFLLIFYVIAATVVMVFNYRYVAHLMSLYVILIAWYLLQLPPKFRWVGILAVAGFYLVADFFYFSVITSPEWTILFGI